MYPKNPMNRRRFLLNASAVLASTSALGSHNILAQDAVKDAPVSNRPGGYEVVPDKIQPFPMAAVRLGPGPMLTMQQRNEGFLLSLPNERLLHMFFVTAALPSTAEPLGGWEAPDCELRGHYAGGHILSACALMYASTGDERFRDKGNALVAELAKCQQPDGYLSAYPTTFYDRLKNHQKVWAPFYTYHKILAGHLDMYVHCGNEQALHTAKGMADWASAWVKPIPESDFQKILNVEYGGMQESLFNLYAITGNEEYAQLARQFSHHSFFDPLAADQDDLPGQHANTHIPQVIGAARGYEVTGDKQYHTIATNFWNDVVTQHSYATGGTSNYEFWHARGTLAKNLGPDAQECCCAYNMMKLSRHVLSWTADARIADQYERMLWNVRRGTQDEAGMLMYYVSLEPGLHRTFGTEFDSFWCCTGTGSEEYSKANDSIYYHTPKALYVSQFIGSTLHWKERGLTLTQETSFPDEERTRLSLALDRPLHTTLMIRVPYWATAGVRVRINGKQQRIDAQPGTYAAVHRTWHDGDRVVVDLPMQLHMAALPETPQVQAVMYGPLVLAGIMSEATVPPNELYGPSGPHDVKQDQAPMPTVKASANAPTGWLRRQPGPGIAFETVSLNEPTTEPITLRPLAQVYNHRYTVYWQVDNEA